jgi:hypothetical protein
MPATVSPPADSDPDLASMPPPARRADLSAFSDRLFDLYGPDRSAWPHPDAWPWEMLPPARAA